MESIVDTLFQEEERLDDLGKEQTANTSRKGRNSGKNHEKESIANIWKEQSSMTDTIADGQERQEAVKYAMSYSGYGLGMLSYRR